jgi:uncharacterized membrane protein
MSDGKVPSTGAHSGKDPAGEGGQGRAAGEPRGGCSRWLGVALVLSLAVNLLVLGAVGTMAYFHFSGAGSYWMSHGKWRGKTKNPAMRHAVLGRPGLMVRALWRTMRALPQERRRALRPLLREHRQAIRAAYAEVGRLRLQLAELLQDPTADRARLEAIAKRLEEAETATRRHIVRLVTTFLEHLTPQERRIFAEKLRQQERRRHLLWRRRE